MPNRKDLASQVLDALSNASGRPVRVVIVYEDGGEVAIPKEKPVLALVPEEDTPKPSSRSG